MHEEIRRLTESLTRLAKVCEVFVFEVRILKEAIGRLDPDQAIDCAERQRATEEYARKVGA